MASEAMASAFRCGALSLLVVGCSTSANGLDASARPDAPDASDAQGLDAGPSSDAAVSVADALVDAEPPIDATDLDTPHETSDPCAGCVSDPFHVATCGASRCDRRCRASLAECDGDPMTSCETNLWIDANNCGACGHACDVGASCVASRCVVRGVRLKAPISASRVPDGRPWFRWELPTHADGALIEVCATPSCDRVEHRWEVTGDQFRPPVALSRGVHFWRVVARLGDRYFLPSRVWEFSLVAVGGSASELWSLDALLDLNGDGAEEHTEGASTTSPYGVPWSVRVSLTRPEWPPLHPDPVLEGDVSYHRYESGIDYGHVYSVSAPMPLGDLNGDGYGDLGLVQLRYAPVVHVDRVQWATLLVYLGGPDGPPSAPIALPVGHAVSNGPSPSGVRAVSVGDRDGDGFGDVLVRLAQNGSADFVTVFGGESAFEVSAPFTVNAGPVIHADFDADGLEDLVDAFESFATRATHVMYRGSVRRTPPVGVVVRECAAPDASAWPLGTPGLDYNDDGYDDLLDSTWRVVYLGGPSGLDGARCVAAPRAP